MEQIALNWEPERRYYTVAELAEGMRVVLGDHFTNIWVMGEISGTRIPGSGHFYFTLKDETAQIQCVCYKMTARYLKFKPADGVSVLARGRIDVYDARGQVQFVVEAMEPQGFGALQLAFEQLKRRLEAEGLFAPERKRPIPPLPERIGIVTSPSGAVIQDILQILERRCPGRHIRLYPAQVQGENAAEQIAAGIDYFSESGWAEVVIVARGGGSLEDLWAFNQERVARAIAASVPPVVSAVGHETDFTIADFVADLRAPTPSAAAELIIATRASLLDRLEAAESKLKQSSRLTFSLLARRLHAVEMDSARLHRTIGRRMQRVDELDYRLRELVRLAIAQRKRSLETATASLQRKDVRLQFAEVRRRLDAAQERIRSRMRLKLSGARTELGPLEAHLGQLSPLKILDRGYAIVENSGRIVKSPEDAPPNSDLRVRLARGEIAATSRGGNAGGSPTPTDSSELPS
jgi:exodeoxyribonuclease VII large subunit